MVPGPVAKERGKGYNDRGEAGGQVQHGGISWRKRCQITASFASPPFVPKSPSEMAKLELRGEHYATARISPRHRRQGSARASSCRPRSAHEKRPGRNVASR